MKIKDLKTIIVPLTLMDKTFKMAFDFNAMAELEEVYGDFDTAMNAVRSGKGRLKAIRALVYSSIKSRHEEITLAEVGELLTDIFSSEDKAVYVIEQIDKATTLAFPNIDDIENKEGE